MKPSPSLWTFSNDHRRSHDIITIHHRIDHARFTHSHTCSMFFATLGPYPIRKFAKPSPSLHPDDVILGKISMGLEKIPIPGLYNIGSGTWKNSELRPLCSGTKRNSELFLYSTETWRNFNFFPMYTVRDLGRSRSEARN